MPLSSGTDWSLLDTRGYVLLRGAAAGMPLDQIEASWREAPMQYGALSTISPETAPIRVLKKFIAGLTAEIRESSLTPLSPHPGTFECCNWSRFAHIDDVSKHRITSRTFRSTLHLHTDRFGIGDLIGDLRQHLIAYVLVTKPLRNDSNLMVLHPPRSAGASKAAEIERDFFNFEESSIWAPMAHAPHLTKVKRTSTICESSRRPQVRMLSNQLLELHLERGDVLFFRGDMPHTTGPIRVGRFRLAAIFDIWALPDMQAVQRRFPYFERCRPKPHMASSAAYLNSTLRSAERAEDLMCALCRNRDPRVAGADRVDAFLSKLPPATKANLLI